VFSEPEGLLKIAVADLETAEGFWLQQAVEKGLKVWLLQHGITRYGTGACSLIGGDQLSDRGSVSRRGRARESLWARRTTEVDQACGAP
jgi:hypothetical protein